MICGVVAWIHTVRARRPVLCLLVVVVLIAATYLGLHAYPILHTLLVAAGFSLVTTIALRADWHVAGEGRTCGECLLLLGPCSRRTAPWLVPAAQRRRHWRRIVQRARRGTGSGGRAPVDAAGPGASPKGSPESGRSRSTSSTTPTTCQPGCARASRVGHRLVFVRRLLHLWVRAWPDDQTLAAVLQQMHPEARNLRLRDARDWSERCVAPSEAPHSRRAKRPVWTVVLVHLRSLSPARDCRPT
jgi:hypothetical protein